MLFRNRTTQAVSIPEAVGKLKKALSDADAVVIGAGAGLSTAAGFAYSGERFDRYFSDFGAKYGFRDMYSGGFHVLRLPSEEMWAYWSRYIWINRYAPIPRDTYDRLFALVRDKDYFVLTTNVDHCFQKTGFDQKRLFYTQGDYGLWQCSVPCHEKTYDNEGTVRKMVLSQGFAIEADGALTVPEGTTLKTTVPTDYLPVCPVCGKPLTMNLRSDDRFVEDEGWHRAAERYQNFLRTRKGRVLYLELGVGYNTPGIIKYPFWNLTERNPEATYACVSFGDAAAPDEIRDRSIPIDGDIGEILERMKESE